MKNKIIKVSIFFISFSITFVLIINYYPLILKEFGTFYHQTFELSKEEKEFLKSYNKGYEDIKNTFSINENDFYKIEEAEELNVFREGNYKNLNDKEICIQIYDILEEFRLDATNFPGITKPIILICKNLNKVLYLYKNLDGCNTMLKAEKINNNWIKSKTEKQGKQIYTDKQINEIKTSIKEFEKDISEE